MCVTLPTAGQTEQQCKNGNNERDHQNTRDHSEQSSADETREAELQQTALLVLHQSKLYGKTKMRKPLFKKTLLYPN